MSAHLGAVSDAPGQAASNDEAPPPPPPPPPPVEPSASLGPAPTTLSHFTAARAAALGGTGSTLTSRGRGLRVRGPRGAACSRAARGGRLARATRARGPHARAAASNGSLRCGVHFLATSRAVIEPPSPPATPTPPSPPAARRTRPWTRGCRPRPWRTAAGCAGPGQRDRPLPARTTTAWLPSSGARTASRVWAASPARGRAGGGVARAGATQQGLRFLRGS